MNKVSLLLPWLFLTLASTCSWAQYDDPYADEEDGYSYEERSDVDRYQFRQKLRRGITNLAAGWMEIPLKTVGEITFGRRSPLENMMVGLFVGTTRGLERTLFGVWETGTFYLPPYDPILRPEYPEFSLRSISDEDEDLGDPTAGLRVGSKAAEE